ncbi:MAG: di-heme oxidoredictase family protein, partial [Cyanobacteria bacterium P01_A01_bin.17]
FSGRPNQVWDWDNKEATLGRFGLKANQPNLLQQSAAAYFNDMGVTNPLFLEADGSSDIDAQILKSATIYAQTLAVPARTLIKDPKVKRGEQLFSEAHCASCHISELRTGQHEYAELENQTIHPYTDLLLHDMGAGLSDNRPDFEATGNEWRTSPLWGIGVAQTVLPYSSYLHDGRARTLEEAILWHGGEAQSAQQTFVAMAKEDRDALVRFLRSL